MADTSQYYTAKTGANKGTTYTSFDVYKQYNQGQLDPVDAPASSIAPTSTPVPLTPPSPAPVNTSQPNPATVNATPYTSSAFYKPETAVAGFDPNTVFNDRGEALDNATYLAQGGKADFSNVQKVSNLQQGLAAAKASGMPAPKTQGEAQSAIKQFTPPSAPNLATLEAQLAEDPGYQQLLADKAEFNSVLNQGKSLLDSYNQMVTDAGIPALNADLLNSKRIIEGTEDDIRNEVKAVSGFATESQVMALAGARNKQLIKNYNNLLDTKAMAMESINNMIGLAAKDRDYALQSISQKMQIDQQLMQYRDKFIQNAKEGYANVINAIGYQGLYESLKNDPSSIALAERTLGLGQGQLQAIGNKQVLANYNITTPYVIKDTGEWVDTASGYGFTSPEDFQEKTGMTLQQAEAKGLVKPLGMTAAQEDKQWDRSMDMAQLQISQRNSDISAGNLALARDKAAWDKQMDLLSLPQPGELSEKDRNDLQSNADYKVIGTISPTIQALKAYKDAIEKHGSWSINSGARGELSSTYGDAIVAWKTAAGLGALSGFDFGLAENVIPGWGFNKKNENLTSKLDSAIKLLENRASQLSTRVGNLIPNAKSVLEEDLDRIYVITKPDQYKVGGDGKVYRITD